MASAGTKQRSSAARRARPKTSENGRAATDKDNRSPARRAKEAVKPDVGLGGSKLVRKAAAKAAKTIAMKSLHTAAAAIRSAADRTVSAGRNAVEAGISKRLPIQVSVDVA